MGVDLFYVLSGFLIGSAVLRPAEWDLLRHAKHRFFRIVPAYYAFIVLIDLFVSPAFLLSWNGVGHIVSHLAFVHNMTISTHGSINGVYWTLGIEATVYVLMTLVAPRPRRSTRSFSVVLSLFLATTYLWRIGIYYFGPADGYERFFLGTQLVGMLDQFALGTLVAFIHLKMNWLESLGRGQRLRLLHFSVFAFLSAYDFLSGHAGDYWFNLTAIVVWRTWIAASFTAAIVFLLATPRSWLDRRLRFSLLSYVGRMSYSIYLLHIPVILSVTAACLEAGISAFMTMLVTGTSTGLVASASYHLIERRWQLLA